MLGTEDNRFIRRNELARNKIREYCWNSIQERYTVRVTQMLGTFEKSVFQQKKRLKTINTFSIIQKTVKFKNIPYHIE